MRLQDKVAVITGAAQGIGLGIAQRFSKEGARVMMLDVNEDIGARAAADISGARFFCTDISDKAAVDSTVDEIIADAGRIDICVNNAGILRSGEVLEISEEDFDKVLSVNLKGAFLMSQATGRHMVAAGGGSIINMSVVEDTVGAIQALICQRAVLDPQPYGKWPSDMRRMIGEDRRKIRFTFYYN